MATALLCIAVACFALFGNSLAQEIPAIGIRLPPSLNFATSPNPVGSGARAVGKGTAFIAVADDATAASHNPAGLVQLVTPEVSVVGSYLLRQETQDVSRPDTIVDDQRFGHFNLNYLSGVYPFELLRRNITVSFNVQRLFDLYGETDVTSRFSTIDGLQHVSSRQAGGLFTISPAVALQITPKFSVGAAFNIWTDVFGGNDWEQNVVVSGNGRVVSGNRIVPFVSEGRIHEDFGFEGFNVTAGFLWELPRGFSLGGVVRTPFTARVSHEFRSTLTVTLLDETNPPPVATQLSFRETLDMDMPLAYGLGFAARPTDNWVLSLDVFRIHWSNFRLQETSRPDVLLVENGAPSGKGRAVLDGKADDTTSVRLGAEYLWRRWEGVQVPVRAGFFYDPEPGAGAPDTFWGFSLGSGVARGRFIFDVAYEFRTGTVKSEATNTSVQQHRILASIIYHLW